MKITIDRNIATIPTDYSWQLGLGNDHAYQLHRTDVCEHIKLEGIKEKTHLRAEPLPFTAENGATKLSVHLRTNDVVLITLTQE